MSKFDSNFAILEEASFDTRQQQANDGTLEEMEVSDKAMKRKNSMNFKRNGIYSFMASNPKKI